MTKTGQLMRDIIAGKTDLQGEKLVFVSGDLEDLVFNTEEAALRAIDSEMYRYLDARIYDICEAWDNCTPEEAQTFVLGVKETYEHVIAMLKGQEIDPDLF